MRTSYDKAQILKYPFLLEEDENMVVIFHHVPIGERNIMVVIATICQCVWTLKLEIGRDWWLVMNGLRYYVAGVNH